MDNNEEILQNIRKKSFYRKKYDMILRVYSILGFLISIFSGVYFLLTLLPYELKREQQLALVVSGVGIALALLSRAIIIFRKQREEDALLKIKEYERIATFLEAWSQFEIISKHVLGNEDEPHAKLSLRSVISRLYEDNKINNADVLALEEALQTRNSIVHGEKPWSSELTEKITDALIEIIRKISL